MRKPLQCSDCAEMKENRLWDEFNPIKGLRATASDHTGHFSAVTDSSSVPVVRQRNPAQALPSSPHLSRFPTILSPVLFHGAFLLLFFGSWRGLSIRLLHRPFTYICFTAPRSCTFSLPLHPPFIFQSCSLSSPSCSLLLSPCML